MASPRPDIPTEALDRDGGRRELRLAPDDSGLTTCVVRTFDEVEALRDTWVALGGETLTADIDFFLTFGRHHPEIERPHVVVASAGDAPVSIVAAYVQNGWISHRIAQWTPYHPTVRAITLAYEGVVGLDDIATATALTAALREALANREADAIHVRFANPTSTFAKVIGTEGRRERLVPPRQHWAATIPGSLDELLSRLSPTTRESLRRTTRRFERDWGDRAAVTVYATPDRYEEMVEAVDAVAVKSYQFEGNHLFRVSALDRELARIGLEKGWYRAYVLAIDGRPAAFWTGFAYGGRFGWRGATGYDPALRGASPGTYLLMRLLDDLCRDPAITVFDLGRGDIAYKQRIADVEWPEQDIRVYGPGYRNATRAAIGTSVGATHQALGRLAAIVGMRTRPTTVMRERLKKDAIARSLESPES